MFIVIHIYIWPSDYRERRGVTGVELGTGESKGPEEQ